MPKWHEGACESRESRHPRRHPRSHCITHHAHAFGRTAVPGARYPSPRVPHGTAEPRSARAPPYGAR
eukprot:4905444-Prymnesium_polylepis.1